MKNNKFFLKIFGLSVGIILISLFFVSFANGSQPTQKRFEKSVTSDMNNFTKQDFNEKYGVIRLSKSTSWVTSDKLAEYSLTKNTEICLVDCEAEGRVVLYQDGKLFDSVKFKTLSGLDTNILNSSYYLLTGYKDNFVQVPKNYKTICESVEDDHVNHINNTYCNLIPKDYDTVNQPLEVWTPYNNSVLSAGNYQWKIKGVKDAKQNVDFIPIVGTNEFSEWATWQSSYNVGLVAFYKLDSNDGGGSSSYSQVANVNSYVCEKTLGYVNNYGQNNFLHLDELKQEMYLEKSYSVDITTLQSYILSWQSSCSELINRTLQEPLVCDKIYYFLVQGNNTYTPYTINNLRLSIKDSLNLDVSNNLLTLYTDNYDSMCLPNNNKPLPFKKTLSTIVMNQVLLAPNCSIKTNNSFFDASFPPLPTISLSEQSCEQINLKRWFFSLENKDDNYSIIGIKLWFFITIIISIIIILRLSFHKKKNPIYKALESVV